MRHLRLFPLLFLPACGSTGSQPSRDDARHMMTGFEQKFDLFDLDGDGYVSRSELTEGLRSTGNDQVSAEDIARIMTFYDSNRDGRISLTEVHEGSGAGAEALLEALGR